MFCVDYLMDASGYLEEARNFSTVLTDALVDYNISDYLVMLEQADVDLMNVNFTEAEDLIVSFKADVAKLSITKELTDQLHDFQVLLDQTISLLKRVVDLSAGGPNSASSGDYWLLAGGYCGNDDAILCQIDGDCSSVGGTCDGKGSYRCSADGATSCTADNTCSALTSGSYCLASSEVSGGLITFLTGYSDTSADVDIDTQLLKNLTDITSSNKESLDEAYDALDSARLVGVQSSV